MNRFFLWSAIVAFSLLGCQDESTNPQLKKLDYYIDSYEISGLGFEPQTKVQYEYDAKGKIVKYTVYTFEPNSNEWQEQRYFKFTYSNSSVAEIRGYEANTTAPFIEYSYMYLPNGKVSKISESNHAAGITSEANFTYAESENKIKAVYTYSNGGGFEYEFNYQGQNIITDKTTKGSQLCSAGEYTYDVNINPFNELGYVDYTLTTFSANNKLTEDVNYVACAFPSFIPVSYSYEYDSDGYPTVSITNFSTAETRRERKFFYALR